MQTITAPSVKIETGLRTFMTANKGTRSWKVVLRINWETGKVDVRRVHQSEGTSIRTYRRFDSEYVLSPKMTNREIRDLVDRLAGDIQTVVAGWSRDLDSCGANVVGRFTEDAQWTRLDIADRIDIANEYCDLEIIRVGGGR